MRAREAGQASVELVAMLPAVIVVAVVGLQLLAAGAAAELAGHAAEAGAIAILQERDPVEAARDAVPGWSRSRLEIRVRGRRVRVRLEPPALTGGLAATLTGEAEAHAGASR